MPFSRIQVINGLCCAIGALLAANAYWIMKYWFLITILSRRLLGWLGIA